MEQHFGPILINHLQQYNDPKQTQHINSVFSREEAYIFQVTRKRKQNKLLLFHHIGVIRSFYKSSCIAGEGGHSFTLIKYCNNPVIKTLHGTVYAYTLQ